MGSLNYNAEDSYDQSAAEDEIKKKNVMKMMKFQKQYGEKTAENTANKEL